MVLGCKKIHKLGRTFSGFSRIFMELCWSKVQLTLPHGNFINAVANPEIVYNKKLLPNCPLCLFWTSTAHWSNGLVVKGLDYQSNPEVPCSKPLGGSKVDSAFHLSEVNQMSTRNFWELSGKK